MSSSFLQRSAPYSVEGRSTSPTRTCGVARAHCLSEQERRPTYASLYELAYGEGVFFVNWGGMMYRTHDVCDDRLSRKLSEAGCNLTALLFAGCLAVLPADVAMQNLGYCRPTDVPRTRVMTTTRGTVVFDLRYDEKYLSHIQDEEGMPINLSQAAVEMWQVVVEHQTPSRETAGLFDFLMLMTGGRRCGCQWYTGTGWRCYDPRCSKFCGG